MGHSRSLGEKTSTREAFEKLCQQLVFDNASFGLARTKVTANSYSSRKKTESVTVDGKTKSIRVQRRLKSFRAAILTTGGN